MEKIKPILFFILIHGVLFGQDSLSNHTRKNNFVIHYYPSALWAGDVSFGAEHRYKNRFAQELSFNVKVFQPKMYYYDNGYRADYLIKYYLYNGNIFRFSSNLSFEYKNIYCLNKHIDYYYQSEGDPRLYILYQTLLEDRRYIEYGLGFGFSLNFKLWKHLFTGADLGINFVKYELTYNYKEIIYRDPNNPVFNTETVPSTITDKNSGPSYAPLLRLKLSYLL